MKALVYIGTNASELCDVEAPVSASGQSIVDLSFCGICGICGSDMHAWHGHDERRIPPLVLGHDAVGTALTGPLAGQRVAVNPLMTCHDCPACDSGNHYLCGTRELIGLRYPGAFAEQVMVPDANLIVLADHLSFSEAALAEPAAVAVRVVEIAAGAGAKPDSRIVILGGGAIGVLVAQVLAAKGFARPRIAETNALRRGMLDNIGIAGGYDPCEETPEDGSVDLLIDCVGMGTTRAPASAMARPGGVIVHVGLKDNEPGLDTRRLTLQEIGFLGAYCYRHQDFATALDLLTDGTVTGKGWTEIRPLDDGAQAFIDIDQGRAPPKIILGTG